jgi:cell division protein FtsW
MDASIYCLRHRDILTFCVLALLGLGILMVQSASMSAGGALGWTWSALATRHLMYVGVALVAYMLVGRLNYSVLGRRSGGWRNPTWWVMGVAVLTCMAVLVPHVGREVNGARRWIALGPIQIQPSELAKWAAVLFMARWISRHPMDKATFFGGFLRPLLVVGLLCALVVIHDFGTAALIGLCVLTMLLVGRARWWHLAIVIPPALAVAFLAVHGVHGESYRWKRMTAFMDPWADPRHSGYQPIQSLLSFSTGGLFGRGLGNGIQKLGYLPEDTTDFIFAVIGEELGLFGAMLTVALYLGIIYVAWQVIRQRRDTFGRMLAFGIASMICLQTLINIAVATVSVPTKGLSLPLVSLGGSGLVVTCAALGLLSSVTRYEHAQEAVVVDDLSMPSAAAAGYAQAT